MTNANKSDIIKEYLRRNLLHAKAVGANANIQGLRERAARVKLPLWLQAGLEGVEHRIRDLPHELAEHRNELKDEMEGKLAK